MIANLVFFLVGFGLGALIIAGVAENTNRVLVDAAYREGLRDEKIELGAGGE